jgi:hypothetical protein
MSVVPSYSVPEECVPLRRDTLDYLRHRITGVADGMYLLSDNAEISAIVGAARLLRMLAECLDFIVNEEMAAEKLVAPIAKRKD